ncbi:hypothetical protein [Paenibacillus lutrae]|uniref:Uncharacterized protein n=1 Tax=Paenibacillus lutrae TaxID=2078573 RepID=A0A7X3FJ10_9BACL|nr:hypothetical protein [Paenibacillus lutrae]MVP00555.1 hypothetical protein [Paenibacillus lutrae]
MDWAKEEKTLTLITEQFEHETVTDFRIEKIHNSSTDHKSYHFDLIHLFFLVPVLKNTGNRKELYIPVTNIEYSEIVVEKFLQYFELAHKVFENNHLTSIKFLNLKVAAQEELNKAIKNHLDTFTHDMYFRDRNADTPISKLKRYRVQTKEFLQHKADVESIPSDLWEFFRRTILVAKGEINISPIGWTFEESLTDSIALRYFVEHAESVDLMVSEDNRIAYFRVT